LRPLARPALAVTDLITLVRKIGKVGGNTMRSFKEEDLTFARGEAARVKEGKNHPKREPIGV